MTRRFDLDDIPPRDETIVCSECGRTLSLETHPKVYIVGEVRPLVPVFCSRQCAEGYDSTRLTVAKLQALRCWLGIGGEHAG